MVKRTKPTVALIYDFDGTLSPLNMQEYDFLRAINIKNKKHFWEENSALVKQHDASNILCYMKYLRYIIWCQKRLSYSTKSA